MKNAAARLANRSSAVRDPRPRARLALLRLRPRDPAADARASRAGGPVRCCFTYGETANAPPVPRQGRARGRQARARRGVVAESDFGARSHQVPAAGALAWSASKERASWCRWTCAPRAAAGSISASTTTRAPSARSSASASPASARASTRRPGAPSQALGAPRQRGVAEAVSSVGWPQGRDEIEVGTLQAKLHQEKGRLSLVREKKATPLRALGGRSPKGRSPPSTRCSRRSSWGSWRGSSSCSSCPDLLS